MSELKAFVARKIDEGTCDPVPCVEVYLKSEADKAMEKLEDKLRAANEQIENLINSASSIMLFQDRVKDNKCDELRHNKYKRCLAMAARCRLRGRLFGACGLYEKELWALKWHKRWLELAEKFKEAK